MGGEQADSDRSEEEREKERGPRQKQREGSQMNNKAGWGRTAREIVQRPRPTGLEMLWGIRRSDKPASVAAARRGGRGKATASRSTRSKPRQHMHADPRVRKRSSWMPQTWPPV